MASGKSTVGALLARALDYTLVDLDRLVEERTGRAVAEWFARGGEAAFRAAEAGALAEAAARARVVIATGGGALVDARNLELARASGVVVYLRVSPETLAARLAGDASRPLLLGPDGAPLAPDTLAVRIRELLAARAAAYERADVTVDASGLAPAATAALVARRLRAWRR